MEVIIRDASDLKQLAKTIRQHSDAKALRKELTGGLREELRPVVQAVKANYAGGKHLRPALRKATRMEVRTAGKLTGVRVRVDGRRMPSGMGSLPAMHEGVERWRHPVFGNRDVWVSQAPRPSFYQTVQRFEPQVQRRMDEIATQIIAKIEQG